MIEYVPASITNAASKVREETIDGKEYLIAPLVAITEGVHTGSEGPVLYKADELRSFVANNDHRPLCLGHPKRGSAASKQFIKTRGCGITLGSVWNEENNSLDMEAHVDKAAASAKDKRLLHNLANNVTTEVSTGYDLKLDKTAGEWKGIAYNAEAKSLHLDHVAILLDQVGACSVAKGAGLLRNASEKEQKFWSELFKNFEDVPESIYQCMERSIKNVLSFDDTNRQLCELLSTTYGEKGKYWEGCVREVFPDKVIFRTGYSSGGKLMMQNYSSKDDVVSLTGTAKEVMLKTEYAVANEQQEPLAGSDNPAPTPGDKDDSMFKKAEHIAALITAGVFNEADKPTLEGWSDDQLRVIKIPKATGSADKVLADQISGGQVKNEGTPTPAPLPEWRKLVPPNELAMLDEMGKVFNSQLKTAIDTIKAAPGNKFTDEQLAAFKPDQVFNIASMVQNAKAPETPQNDNNPLYGMFWGGRAGVPQTEIQNSGEPKPPAPGQGLGVVSMWDDKAAA